MMVAANLDTGTISSIFKSLENSPYKADVVEHGLDVEKIRKESQDAEKRLLRRDLIIFVATIIGGIVGYKAFVPYYNAISPSYILIPLLMIAYSEFSFQSSARSRARKILNGGQESRKDIFDSNNNKNNIVISGGYSPFVGSGYDVTGWSFTVNLKNKKEDSKELHGLSIIDLYEETVQDIEKLCISGISVKDEIYIDGRDARKVPDLFPDGEFSKPLSYLPASSIEGIIGNNDTINRHYKVVRIPLWDGQIILSYFLRYVIIADSLFVETKIFMLPPLVKKYQAYEAMPLAPISGEFFKDVTASILKSTVIWIPVLFKALIFLQGGFMEKFIDKTKASKKEIRENTLYNYGHSVSLREQWSLGNYERYFQMVDKDFHVKVVKETLMESLLNSLKKRNISIEAFKQASTQIYNEGIIISGGNIKAER